MTVESLGYISELMENNNVPYGFMEWFGETIPDTYFVGEYLESDDSEEDGFTQSTLILTGFSRTSFLALETYKATIKRILTTQTILDNKQGIALSYNTSTPILIESDIKKMQINILVKEWKVN